MKAFSFFKKKTVIEESSQFDHWPEKLQPIEPEALLTIHQDSVHRFKLAWSDASTWHQLMLPVIKQYAYVTQRLPYQAQGIFSQTDGLFLAGIQAASFAVDIMEESFHLERNIMSQALLQSRLKGAAACAALLGFLHALVNRMTIQPQGSDYRPFFEIDETNYVKHAPFNPLASTYYQWTHQRLLSTSDTQPEPPQLIWAPSVDRSKSQCALNLFLARLILTQSITSQRARHLSSLSTGTGKTRRSTGSNIGAFGLGRNAYSTFARPYRLRLGGQCQRQPIAIRFRRTLFVLAGCLPRPH